MKNKKRCEDDTAEALLSLPSSLTASSPSSGDVQVRVGNFGRVDGGEDVEMLDIVLRNAIYLALQKEANAIHACEHHARTRLLWYNL